MLAYTQAQGRHQGLPSAPVPGLDRSQRIYLGARVAQAGQQGLQVAAGIATRLAGGEGAQVVVEAPGLAGRIDADGGLGGGHRQAVDQLVEAMVMAEQAGPVVVGGQGHAEALLQPLLRRDGQRRCIDKQQLRRTEGLGEQGCRQPEGQGRGFHS
ncbi:hypothetical protein D3C80_1528710 [compost metagenome]